MISVWSHSAMGWEPVKCHKQGRASPKMEVGWGKPREMLSHTVGMNQENWLLQDHRKWLCISFVLKHAVTYAHRVSLARFQPWALACCALRCSLAAASPLISYRSFVVISTTLSNNSGFWNYRPVPGSKLLTELNCSPARCLSRQTADPLLFSVCLSSLPAAAFAFWCSFLPPRKDIKHNVLTVWSEMSMRDWLLSKHIW